MKPWLYEGQPKGHKGDAQRALEQFTHSVESFEHRLGSLVSMTRLKSRVQQNEAGFETLYDEQLRFVRRAITGIDHPFVRPDVPFYLNDLLCPEDFVGGRQQEDPDRTITHRSTVNSWQPRRPIGTA